MNRKKVETQMKVAREGAECLKSVQNSCAVEFPMGLSLTYSTDRKAPAM
jgi:hypothetical protein